MLDIKTSDIVAIQIPDYLEEEGPTLVAFIKAYYEWLDASQYGNDIELIALTDVDETVDEFLIYFKETYLPNFPNLSPESIRLFTKNIGSFYNARGTEDSFKLLFRILYKLESSVYNPGKDVLVVSDGKWRKPVYIETTPITNPALYVDKGITGSISGSTAVVENIVRKSVNGNYFSVVFISNIRGQFIANEAITTDGILAGAPIILGSLNSIDIIQGGQDNEIGDEFTIVSNAGKYGKARVVSIENGTGRVNFTLEDGGSGYTLAGEATISDRIYTFESPIVDNFVVLEGIQQASSNVSFLSANNMFTVGDTVNGYTTGTNIFQGSGTVVTATQVGANGAIKIVHLNDYTDFDFADYIAKSGNTVSAIIDTVQDTTATANVVGFDTAKIGIYNTNNVFYLSHSITGDISNTTGVISSQSTGFGAGFNIGSLTGEETVWINTDGLSHLNTAGVSYLDISLDGSGSGVGYVNSAIITSGGTGYANSASVVFAGGGTSISGVSITAPGTGYANGERLVFTSTTGAGASGIVTTNGAGAIITTTIGNTGSNYRSTPTVTVANTAGTGASLIAVSSPTTNAIATVLTNGSGVITSVNVSNQGAGFFSTPTITVAGGTGANLTATMQWGYGFPKFPSGGSLTIINQCLTTNTVTIGTISALSQISPGQDYNQDPFVLVIEPFISALGKKDIILSLTDTVGAFTLGEIIEQNVIDPAAILAYTTNSGPGFENGEIITKGSTTGIVYSRTPGVVRVFNIVNGPFTAGVATSNISNTNITINTVTDTTRLGTAKGRVRAHIVNEDTLIISRLSFNTSFNNVQTITGLRSNATALIALATPDADSQAMGNNAIVTAEVRTANGIVSTVEIVDSGYAYYNSDILTLTSADSQFAVTGVASVNTQGNAEGYWINSDGFLNADKYIQDGNYYQAYSYEIQVGVSLDRYADIIKKLLHTAGTKMFGKYILVTSGAVDIHTDSEVRDGLDAIVN